tara:strand:- start:47 stop:373 length:327 start_codon:yes stop_codon:yes gene_type:complete
MAINSTTDIHLAIEQLGLTGKGNTYALDQSVPPHNIIKWDSANPDSQPTDDEINAAYTTWKNANDYKLKREEEYPDWSIQLDYIYHNGIDKWKTDIVDPVKSKYPKPS